MKQIIVFFFFCFSTSCHPRQRETLVFSKYPKELTVENGVLFFKNKKFDGILIQLQQNAKDTLLFQTYSNGEMDGISKKWYPNRQLMEYRQYRKGKKEGKTKDKECSFHEFTINLNILLNSFANH